MTNKKKYQAPAFEVIKLKSQPCLQNNSPTAVDPGKDPGPDPDPSPDPG
jgi:hypothetical protein